MGLAIQDGFLPGFYKDRLPKKPTLRANIKDEATSKPQVSPPSDLGPKEYYDEDNDEIAIFTWKESCKDTINEVETIPMNNNNHSKN